MRWTVAALVVVGLGGCWMQDYYRRQVGALTRCRADDVRIVAEWRSTLVADDCRGERHTYRTRGGEIVPLGE